MKKTHLTTKANKQFSNKVLIALLVSSLVLFVLFFLVGYNMPSLNEPTINEPLLTTPLLFFVYVVMLLSMGVSVWAIVKAMLLNAHSPQQVNGIAVKKLNRAVFIGLALLLIIAFFIGSNTPILINGSKFNNVFWLKTSDMFITTSCLLLGIASATALWGILKNYKRS